MTDEEEKALKTLAEVAESLLRKGIPFIPMVMAPDDDVPGMMNEMSRRIAGFADLVVAHRKERGKKP